MNIKYMGRDVHKETISIAVMNAEGKLVMESIIETKASTLLQLIQGLRGDLHVTLEEGTWAAWLYALAEAARQQAGGVRSTEKRSAAGRPQERQDRRTPARRPAARRISALGLPWPEWATNLEGAGPQLSDISKDLTRVMTCVTQIEIG